MTQTKKINKLEIYTDGGSRGNPGPAGIGVHAIVTKTKEVSELSAVCSEAKDSSEPQALCSDSKILFQLSEYIGEATNNVAEYTATIKALEYLSTNNTQFNQLDFFLDSELVVKQIKGEYKIKKPHLQTLHRQVKDLLNILKSKNQESPISFNYIPRDQNKTADSLVNKALDSI